MIDKQSLSKIRNSSPYPVAKLIEGIVLENDPRLRCQKIIDLFELTFQLLVVFGIGFLELRDIPEDDLLPVKEALIRPTMGTWKDTMLQVVELVRSREAVFLVHYNKKINNSIYLECLQEMSMLIELDIPGKPILTHFLNALVTLRNDRFAHGSILKTQAADLLQELEAAAYQWILDIVPFRAANLMYVSKVEWQDPDFVCYGLNINRGTFIEPHNFALDEPLKPDIVYLFFKDSYINLFPYVVFNEESKYFYIFNRSESSGSLLRCPYHIDNKKDIVIDESIIDQRSGPPDWELGPYHETLTEIKKRFNEDWLTKSQEQVWNQYLKIMEPPAYVVNIYGPKGSGKTFLGWLMEKKGYGRYVIAFDIDWDALEGEDRVILDQYDVSRRSLRSLRSLIKNRGIKQAVVLSRGKAQDDIPCLELTVNQEDINIVKANLYRELEIVVPGETHNNLADCFMHLEERNAE